MNAVPALKFDQARLHHPNQTKMSRLCDRAGETPLAAALSSERRTVSATVDGQQETKLASMEIPPAGDVCPICFGNFNVPCRASCGHWYCGSCIVQHWRLNAAFQPCKCLICLQRITKLIPEASLFHTQQAETSNVLRNVGDYNRLFVGGISGIMMKFLVIPSYIKRIFGELLDPERPGVYFHQMRIIAVLLALLLYSFAPFNIGLRKTVHILDESVYALSIIFYLVGVFLHWKRERNVNIVEFAAMPEAHED